MKKSIAAVAMATTILAGCGGNTLRYAGVSKQADDPGVREAGQVTLTCKGPNPSELNAVAVAGIGIAVDAALGAISKSLANAQKARTGSWTAANSTDTIAGGCKNGKLEIVRGVFPKPDGLYPAFELSADVTIADSIDSKAWVVTIEPKSLIYSDTSAKSRGKGRKDVTISLSIASVGEATSPSKNVGATSGTTSNAEGNSEGKKPETKPALSSANLINLGRLEIGKKYDTFNTSMSFTVPKGKLHNLSVVVTESEDPSVVLEAFAAAFESNKSDLGKALRDAIAGSDD
jgi:hypothetical protein